MPGDTIAAIATAPGAGGIGVVRVSGPASGVIAHALLGRPPVPRHAHFAAFRGAAGEPIDRGLLLWFPAPASYTGEDVLELQGHGSPVLLRLLLERCIKLGARPARPGEFSERAFLNGKLDLLQAEAVADVIASGSEAAARAALRSLEGVFSDQVHALVEGVVALRVWVEAAIDFPEEEIDFLADARIGAELARLQQELDALLAGARRGLRLGEGLHVVILGRPNVGKSSLLNALARQERAIVTDIAGTTRDVLREELDLDGVALTLVDTAGLREAGDRVEAEGIRRARAELARADRALLVTDGGEKCWQSDLALLDGLAPGAARWVVHNKIDARGESAGEWEQSGRRHFRLSARSGEGLAALLRALRAHALGGETAAEGTFSARARHVAALERAAAHLAAAGTALGAQQAGELAAEELRLVQQALGELTGEFTPDDLLGAIFASFCIGK